MHTRKSLPEATVAYESFLFAAAGSAARLKATAVRTCARVLFPELGQGNIEEFASKLAACFSWARQKALKVSAGERLRPPSLGAAIAAFKSAMKVFSPLLPMAGGSCASSGKSSSPASADKGQASSASARLCQSREEVLRAYGLRPTPQPARLIEISSDEGAEGEEEEEGDGRCEPQEEESKPDGG